MVNIKFKLFTIKLIFLFCGCVPPPYEPDQNEISINDHWENTGKISASFISSSRTLGVNTNTGSPSFSVSFIASASNIDSLSWSFPGGKTNDSISEITETVVYEKFGKFDVGLEVFNADDTDKRYFKDFIDIFYKDDLDFRGIEATSWTVTGTSAVTSDFQYPLDSTGNTYESWVTIPYTSEHMVSADKNFENFPSNSLTLEFEYKIEKVPVMYISASSITGTSISSPSDAVYIDPQSASSSDTKINISSITNFSINRYNFKPLNRQTNFGTLDNPLALIIFYNGEEKDKYSTFFNSFSLDFMPNQRDTYTFNTSFYNTNEKEYFDILAQYNLAEVNSNIGDEDLGEVEFSQGVGSQLNHARNNLNAQILNVESKLKLIRNKNEFNFSLKFTSEKINDRIVEWEVIDSAGYLIDPPFLTNISEQPYEANQGPIVPFQNIRATTESTINRIQFYSQWENESYINDNKIYYNLGFRVHNWSIDSSEDLSNNTVVSPRLQIGYIPNWNPNMIFNLKYGIYHQPPFYKELRSFNGQINPSVEAQKSTHYVFSNEYKFDLWKRPFKLNSEIYYKDLENINPYTIDNVRIRYQATNNAFGYAYGLDLRLNGEFVKGTESWFSFGYLKTEENIDNRGYISRPTDQRLKFGILFQDYVPNMPNLKMFINLIYNTGLPGGSPSYADPYAYQNRLPDYKRADLGIMYLIKDSNILFNVEEFSIGFEIFNMFNIQNTITNTWVRDVYSKRQYSIPNYLSPRIFNLNMEIKF